MFVKTEKGGTGGEGDEGEMLNGSLTQAFFGSK